MTALDLSTPIDGTTLLLRRVGPRWVIRDKQSGAARLSSGAFQELPKGSGRVSVTLEDDLLARGASYEDALFGQADYGLVAVKAQVVYDADRDVERTPTGDDPSHGDIVGSISGSFRDLLASQAVWLIRSAEELVA